MRHCSFNLCCLYYGRYPYFVAALGELISERAGVTNLGVGGMMLVGACAGFIAAQQTGSLLSGVGMALLAGSLMALIHAFLTVTLRANQVSAVWR